MGDSTTGSDGLPFIGSLMSLVSHGDIRYEGTLYTIDMPNSTIALSNVRCFGTEGRRKENQVPPSDQVFEYVVFKGSEIKELTVVQPPAPAPPPPAPPLGFSDPAIVSAGVPPPGPPPGAAAPWGAPPPPPPYSGGPGGPPSQAPFGSSPWGAPAGPPPPGPPPGQPAPAPAPTVAITAVNGGGQPLQQHRPSSYAHAAGGRGPAPARGGRGGGRGGDRGGRGGPYQNQGPHQHHQHQHQHQNGGPRGGQQQQQPRPPPVEVPKEEFDFEEALKKFKKESLEREAEEAHVLPPAAKQTYVKDDFFDQLSCDAMERLAVAQADDGEREDWRAKMAAQRKVDVETFGGLGVSRGGRGYRGRGRGRGYGYGGGRGGGGGGRGRGGQQQQQAQAV